ncbi:MAG TPA: HD domain-containing protein [Bryobacteraceae bacterium]
MFSDKFDAALVFAHRLHRRQLRKTSGAPYVAHLLGVAASVMEDGGSEDETIAALLHDSIEDQARHYPGGAAALTATIEREFGPGVLRLVEALTERPDPSEQGIPDRRGRWRAHKEAYIRQIVTADPAVRRISSADSLYNVRSLTRDYLRMGDQLWTRFLTRSRDDQLWAYDAVAHALQASGGGALAAELDRAVEELFRVTGVERGR